MRRIEHVALRVEAKLYIYPSRWGSKHPAWDYQYRVWRRCRDQLRSI